MIFLLFMNVFVNKVKEWFNLEYIFDFNILCNIKDEVEIV